MNSNAPDGVGTEYLGEFRLTDVGNAERLARRYFQELRHSPLTGWFWWDGCRYRRDEEDRALRFAIDTASSIYHEAAEAEDAKERKELAAWAARSESAQRIRAMLDLARARPEISIAAEQLDRDPMLLNVLNGTIDLRTGELNPHNRTDLITRLAPVQFDPRAEAPLWKAFLTRVFDGDRELIDYVRRVIGYALTGSTDEHAMFILWGQGANGKTVLVETIHALLGDYALTTPADTLLAKRQQGVTNDIARMRGARIVSASETEHGRALAESLVKSLTGGDTIVARFLFRELFQFKPQFKLFLVTNAKPKIAGGDEGIWRRLRLVPFAVTIPRAERDARLAEKLREELPGILRWALEGCLDWQERGLADPPAVLHATEVYRDEQDELAGFLSECCIIDKDSTIGASQLFTAYTNYARLAEVEPMTQTRFGKELNTRGFNKIRNGSGVKRVGLQLKSLEVVNSTEHSNGNLPLDSLSRGKIPTTVHNPTLFTPAQA